MSKKSLPLFLAEKKIFILLALLYAAGAIFSSRQIIAGTQASARAFEQTLTRYNLKNEAEQAVDRYSQKHPIMGTLFSSPIKHTLDLPSRDAAQDALHEEIPALLKIVRQQSALAGWWSCFLLSFSLSYVVAVIALAGSFTARAVLFSMTCVSVVCFVIGVIAPAMVIWTAPSIPFESGTVSFVLQHEVRGIAAIIWELLHSDHWIIGGFLLLFSVVTPLTKAALTLFVTTSPSKALNSRIGQLLHSIGKWSMADVFVAGVLLSLYALKFQQATRSIACPGLYYFIGYCLLSMVTTELLVHSSAAGGKAEQRLGRGAIGGLCAGLLCFICGAILYTYAHETAPRHEKLRTPLSPQQLKEEDLPIHK